MHHFEYKNGVLHAEDVNLVRIADEVGTPFYCYSSATLERHYRVFLRAFGELNPLVCYSVKANSNQAVIATLGALGAGMDVVSEGELRRVIAAGVAPERIIFAGIGKTQSEMARALEVGIHSFNVESEAELLALSEIARSLGRVARIALRVNPDVDPRTHEKIATGKAENKFGIAYADASKLYQVAGSLPHIEVIGVHMHIGSQLTDLEPFRRAFALLRALVVELREQGHDIHHVDLGGGLGVPYRGTNDVPPHPSEYAALVHDTLGDLNLNFALEPGRMVAGNAGILVSEVVYAKPADDKTFLIIDAAMNDLIRPTLYDAYHDIWPLSEAARHLDPIPTDVVGPVCETGDFIARGRAMPPLQPGDRIAIMTAGAYGAVQSSTYNSRLLIPEVLVKNDLYAVVRPRRSYEELIALDEMAPWLAKS